MQLNQEWGQLTDLWEDDVPARLTNSSELATAETSDTLAWSIGTARLASHALSGHWQPSQIISICIAKLITSQCFQDAAFPIVELHRSGVTPPP